jgi:hypothetical protein
VKKHLIKTIHSVFFVIHWIIIGESIFCNSNQKIKVIILHVQKTGTAEFMNAYPVSPEIKSPKTDGKQLVDAVGERLELE